MDVSAKRARRALTAVVIAGVLALVTTGCGRHGTGSSASQATTADLKPKADPCRLVPAAEASRVLGPIASATEHTPMAIGVVPNQRVCAISLASDSRLGANVGLAVVDPSKADRLFTGMGPSEAVPGLGQQARWFELFRVVLALQGRNLISVQLRGISADAAVDRDHAVGLARIAVAHVRG